jgi:hypothetical protein
MLEGKKAWMLEGWLLDAERRRAQGARHKA